MLAFRRIASLFGSEKYRPQVTADDKQPYGFVNPVYIDIGIKSPSAEELIELRIVARDVISRHIEGNEFHALPIVNRQYYCSLAAMALFQPLPFVLENDDFGEFGGTSSVKWEVLRVPSVDDDMDILIQSTQITVSDQVTGTVTRYDLRSAQFSVHTGDLVAVSKETWIKDGKDRQI
jgi:hypothetical protein